nr:unnamed protein product [Callosobruchus analis]
MGIPQGSVLGPVLFIIFINDIKSIVSDKRWYNIIAYADDTNILVKGDGILDVKHKSNEVFKSSKEWFTRNRLVINADKTNGVLFKTNRANIHEPEYLNIGDTHVKLTKTVKFLGLIVDNTLSWSEHVESIQKRLSSSIYSLRVLKRYTDNDTQTEHSGYYNCIKMYNYLPRNLKDIDDMKKFKKEVFKYLNQLEPYSIEDYIRDNYCT